MVCGYSLDAKVVMQPKCMEMPESSSIAAPVELLEGCAFATCGVFGTGPLGKWLLTFWWEQEKVNVSGAGGKG